MNPVQKRVIQWALLSVLAAGLLGCSQKNESQADASGEGYPVVGLVIDINSEEGSAKIKHEEIPGFMPAMTMDFRLDSADLEKIKAEDKIHGRLVRDEDGGFRLIEVKVGDQVDYRPLEKTNRKLAKKTKSLPSGRYFGEGDETPEFALLNQNGEVVSVKNLRGKAFMMNFIFTRCTDAKMCPLSTSKMATMQRLAQEQQVADLAFVSVSLDPEYDTPSVLKRYAEAYGIEDEGFHFVTGPMEAVGNMIRSFGVTSLPRDETIMHSLATMLVSEKGEILMRSERSDWSPEAFLARLQKSRHAPSNS